MVQHRAFERAVELLNDREVLVSYSGGKDSMILMDIASRCAKKVAAFHMEVVPHLPVMDARLKWAEDKWGIPIARYPHWLRSELFIAGEYCFHKSTDVPHITINDIYAVARAESGIQFIVTGAKKGDSLWRRRTGVSKFAKDDLKAPLWDWSTRDVYGYLKSRGIEAPKGDGRNASGIDLSHECILWLYDHHRESYDIYERTFPFIGAVIKLRDWYGIAPKDYQKQQPT